MNLTQQQRDRLDRAIQWWEEFGSPLLDVIEPVVAQMLADERDRIAREVEAHREFFKSADRDDWTNGFFSGLNDAARIARGQE